jgi:acetyl esterase/lipase
LHEVEVDYYKQFSSVSSSEDIERKRIFLEATTLITNIRYKVIDDEIIHDNLPLLKLSPHPTLFTPNQTAILYLHGGMYCLGSPRTHQEFCSLILRRTRCRVFLPQYRLAPEHASPAAVEDVISAYEYLRSVEGYTPERIIVMGDCAGGGLAAGLILSLKQRQLPLPAAVVMLSPVVDLSEVVDEQWKNKRTRDIVCPSEDYILARAYCGASDPRDPIVSPTFGDLSLFPPTLIQVGGFESLKESILNFAQKLKDQNVDVSCEEYDTEVRVFHTVDGSRHQDQAVKSICTFIKSHVAQ